MPIKACVFDAYGTLFDVAAAARIAAAEPEHAKLAAIWPQLARDLAHEAASIHLVACHHRGLHGFLASHPRWIGFCHGRPKP